MRKQLFVTLLLTCGMPFSAQMQALANPEPQTQGQGQVNIKGTVLDENDEPVRTEPRLLLSPLSLTLEEGFELVRQFGGVAVPAHIDRPSHGIIPILGFINPHLGVCCVEVSPLGMANGFSHFDPRLRVLSSSDAHDLGAILERQQELDLPECSTEAFLSYISGK